MAPPAQDVILRRLQALAEPTRLDIIRRLTGGECCVCDLQDDLEAGQSRLSFHLKKLKEAGLVEDRRVGRWAYYTLVPEALAEVRAFLGVVEADMMTGGGCCPG